MAATKGDLYRFVRRYVGDADESFDLVQETFLGVIEHRHEHDELQRRLLVWMLLPLGLVGLVSFWLHYQSAGTAALQQDQQLQRLMPLLSDSVVVTDAPNLGAIGDLDQDPGLALLLILPLVLMVVLENFGYRQLNSWWRLIGLWRWATQRESTWGDMKRKGLSPGA